MFKRYGNWLTQRELTDCVWALVCTQHCKIFTQLSSVTEGFKLCWKTGQKLTLKPSFLTLSSILLKPFLSLVFISSLFTLHVTTIKKIKKKEIDCNASAYCREHWRARHAWFQMWLICGGDQRKSRQDRKRKQRQSMSEGIIKRVKGDDAEPRLAKQRHRMANHRARER